MYFKLNEIEQSSWDVSGIIGELGEICLEFEESWLWKFVPDSCEHKTLVFL